MGGGGVHGLVEGLKPAAGMVAVQVVFAGVVIFYKLAVNDGMDTVILITYRNLLASAVLAPLAYFLERKSRPKLTWMILMQGFLCGLFGGTLAQNFYIASVKFISPTFVSAVSNLIPAVTFVLAILFRLENLEFHTASGQAKIIGTIIGIGGAMLLTFYKGVEINLWPTNVNLLKDHHGGGQKAIISSQESRNHIIGSLSAFASCLAYAAWLIVQAKMTKVYPCHYSCTALMNLAASVQCAIFSLCIQRDWAQWRIGFNIRLLSVAYTGIVSSALIFSVMSWCIERKGPLYASIFNPLMLVFVAILSSLLLKENLYTGSILGSVLIVIGLYVVLWGKGREAAKAQKLVTVDVPSSNYCEGNFELSNASQLIRKEEEVAQELTTGRMA